jgi:hypothetical protein
VPGYDVRVAVTVLVRPLDLFDIPSLGRYRRSVLALDSAAALTRGNLLAAGRLLAYLDPRHRLYTAVMEAGDVTCLGQIACRRGERVGRLVFVAPGGEVEQAAALYEHLAARAGQWHLPYLLAEVEEHCPLFQTLRLGGFATYAWQRIWTLPSGTPRAALTRSWQVLRGIHLPEAQSLYAQIVPPLLQPVEPWPQTGRGLVCRAETVSAWARVVAGPRGVWVQPLIHPDSDCAPEHLLALAWTLAPGGRRPVYLCVRSYQAWLEPLLEDLGALAGPRQAVMVKRLAVTQKVEQALPKMEKAWVKPAAPGAAYHFQGLNRHKQ